MEDFPPCQDDRPRVPWAKAVQRTATSSQAPGPPARGHGNNTKKREKTPQKLAATLRGMSASDASGGESSGGREERRSGSGERQVNGHTSDGVDGWDPMAEDYQSPSFNSYDRGPGALLKAGQEGNESGNICLFVDKIPLAITKDGLRNLFSRAGQVMKVHIVKQINPGRNTTFGFVEFATVREADTALQMLNKFDMGHGVQLVVKIAENQTDRHQRLAKKREEEAFLNTLNCTKYETKSGASEGEDYEMSEREVSKGHQNPFVPRYTPHHSSGPDSPIPANVDSSPTPTSLSSSAGAASLRAQSSPGNPETAESFGPKVPSPDGKTGNIRSGWCTVCGQPCSSKCARCKAPYCSEECQRQDWARHKVECKPPGSTGSESPHKKDPVSPARDDDSSYVNGPLKIAQTSDDEGFHVTALDDSDLEEFQEFLEQVAQPPQSPASSRGSTGVGETPESTGLVKQAHSNVSQPVPQGDVGAPARQDLPKGSSPTKHVQFVDKGAVSDHEQASDVTSGKFVPEVLIPLSEIMYLFESAAYPLASIPINAPLPRQFIAVVTSILGGTRFSVIPLSVEAKQILVRLQQFAREASLDPVNPDELTVGSKCGLLLNQEGFLRVEVAKPPQGDKVVVKRFDLGGQLCIPLTILSRLPEEILCLPCVRTRCALLYLFDNREFPGGAEFLFSQLQGSPVKVLNMGATTLRNQPDIKITRCKLESADGTVDIHKAVESSLGVHKSTVAQSPPHSTGLSASPRSTGQTGKPVVQSPGRSREPAPPTSLHSPYKMVHFANKVPSHCPPRGCSFDIHPTVVTNPSVIWAHVVHDQIGVLYRMQDDLNMAYKNSKNDSYSPTVGEICAAKFSNDQKFYRAEVMCVNHDGTVDVHYVDFGNRETILVGQLRHLAPVFLTLPKQALQFTLAGIKPVGSNWSDGAIACLKERIMSKTIKVEIVSEAPKTFFVKLFDPELPAQVFNDEMVSMGHAVYVDVSRKRPRDLTSPLRGVSITHSSVSPSATSPFQKSPPAARHTLLPTPPGKPAGTPQDSSWKLHPREKLREGGMSSSAPQRPLQPHTPPLSPPPHTDTSTGSDASRKALDEKSSPNDLQKPSLLGSPPKISYVQLPQHPKKQDGTQGQQLSPPTPDVHSLTGQFTPNESSGRVSEKRKIEKAQGLQEGRSEHVLVSHVDNPYQFWVQVLDEKSLGTLLELTQKLNKAPLKQAHPRAGENCVCRYSQDGSLYRGRVNSITDMNATVQFVDYGNTEEVPLTDLFEAEGECFSLPAQAILCTLNQLLNPKGRAAEWEPAAIDFFKAQCFSDKVVVIKTVKALGLKHVVDVTVPSESGEKSLLQLMVESGHGSSINLKSPSKGKGQQHGSTKEKQSGAAGGGSEPRQGAPWKGRPGSEHGQGAPWKRAGSASEQGAPQKRPGSESGQGAPWKRAGSESGQGAPWKRAGSEFGQGAPQKRHGSESGQGAPWKRPGSESGQGAPWKRPGQGGTESRQEAPWKGKSQQEGNKQHYSSNNQPAAPQPNQGSQAPFPSQSNKKGSPNQPRQDPLPGMRSPKSLPDALPLTQLPHLPKVASLTVVSPPTESDYFEVLASEVQSPHSLFLQVANRSSAQALNELSSSLNSHLRTHPSAPLAQPAAKGSLCCSKFSQDNMWYRAEVVEVFQGGCVVRFIDFGNTDSVQTCDLVPCPAQFLDTPIMAIQCSLKGVSPVKALQTSLSSGKTGWSIEAITFLKRKCLDRILLGKMVGHSHELGLPLVELIDTSSEKDVSMAEELINAGHATTETVQRQSRVDQVPIASPVTQTAAQTSPQPIPVQSPLKPSSPNDTNLSELSIAPLRLPEGVIFKVHVTDTVDPSCFSVQRIVPEHLASFMDLMNQLQLAYCDPTQYSGFQPAVGAVCCTRYQVDDCWYRCQVIGLSWNQAELCYLDFGNTEVVPVQQIFHLDPKFATLPSFAVQCSLRGVKPVSGTGWTGEAVQKFTSLLDSAPEKTLYTKVLPGAAENTPVLLELYFDESGARSVADALLESGLARCTTTPSTPTPQPAGQAPPSPAAVDIPLGIPPFVLPASPEFRALMTHTDSLTKFYLQVVTSDTVKIAMAAMEKMNRHCCAAQGFSRPPDPGDLCLGKYGQEWFRAQVLRQIAQDRFEIHFIDFGNKEAVSLGLMKPMIDDFLSLPVQAVRCGLYGVPAGEVMHPSTSALEAFSQLTTNVTLICRVVCHDPLLVDLKDASRATLSVREELAKLHLFLPIDDSSLITLPTNKLPTDTTSVVLVAEIVSPGDFWVQVGEANTLMELDKMARRMHNYCTSCPPFSSPPVLGQMCFAKFSEDGRWYRARVSHIPAEGSTGVRFVDYGNQEVLSISELRPFKQEFQYIPAQAIHCCLVGFESAGAEGAGFIKNFQELVENRRLIAIHKGMRSEGVTVVELVDTSTAKDVYIHKEMK